MNCRRETRSESKTNIFLNLQIYLDYLVQVTIPTSSVLAHIQHRVINSFECP